MDNENHLSQQESDLATGGPVNQLNGDGASNTNPYAQDVTPEPVRRGGRGANNDLTPMRDQFRAAEDLIGAAAVGGAGPRGPEDGNGAPADQARMPTAAPAAQLQQQQAGAAPLGGGRRQISSSPRGPKGAWG